MSRLAKKPIKILSGVNVTTSGDFLIFKGPKGENKVRLPLGLRAQIDADKILVEVRDKDIVDEASLGTTWSHIKNAIQGIADGFLKILEIEGIGYRAQLEGKELVLFLGYAEPVRFKLPETIKVEVEKNTIKISGVDKDLVGRVASDIRALKKPEPYKGKGIRYRGEIIKRKVGKKAAAATPAS